MPFENKWSESAERDLIMSLLLNDSEADNIKVKVNWVKVHERMVSWGYSFTKDAINQRWSKVILKEFRSRRSDGIDPSGTPATPTPRKRARNSALGSGSKRRRPNQPIETYDSGEDSEDQKKMKPVKKLLKDEDETEIEIKDDDDDDFDDDNKDFNIKVDESVSAAKNRGRSVTMA